MIRLRKGSEHGRLLVRTGQCREKNRSAAAHAPARGQDRARRMLFARGLEKLFCLSGKRLYPGLFGGIFRTEV